MAGNGQNWGGFYQPSQGYQSFYPAYDNGRGPRGPNMDPRRVMTPGPGAAPNQDADYLRRMAMTPGPSNYPSNTNFSMNPQYNQQFQQPNRTPGSSGRPSNAAMPPPPSPPQKLAPSLSCRQLFQQRLQKYSWSATFHLDCEGPAHAQKWIGSFYIKGTLLGKSGPENTKDRAKEAAAKAALDWMNKNHYY